MIAAPLTQDALRRARRTLGRRDPRLRPWFARIPEPVLSRPHTAYAALCRAVVAQQVSNQAAKAINARFFAGGSRRGPTPAQVAARSDETLRGMGLSRPKVRYIRGLTEAFRPGGSLYRRPFARMADEAVIESLTALPGIGRWTAEMFLIFWLHRPDVFAEGDLALRNGLCRLHGSGPLTPRACGELAAQWAPHRTVASLYLWRIAHYQE